MEERGLKQKRDLSKDIMKSFALLYSSLVGESSENVVNDQDYDEHM